MPMIISLQMPQGRRNGYSICYYNQTLGKTAMGFDGLKGRTSIAVGHSRIFQLEMSSGLKQ